MKSHLTKVFRELGVTDRTQAALWMERHRAAEALRVLPRIARSDPHWSQFSSRRVAWRGAATTSARRDGFRVRRTVPDYAGADEVSARAANRRGLTCQARATLRG